MNQSATIYAFHRPTSGTPAPSGDFSPMRLRSLVQGVIEAFEVDKPAAVRRASAVMSYEVSRQAYLSPADEDETCLTIAARAARGDALRCSRISNAADLIGLFVCLAEEAGKGLCRMGVPDAAANQLAQAAFRSIAVEVVCAATFAQRLIGELGDNRAIDDELLFRLLMRGRDDLFAMAISRRSGAEPREISDFLCQGGDPLVLGPLLGATDEARNTLAAAYRAALAAGVSLCASANIDTFEAFASAVIREVGEDGDPEMLWMLTDAEPYDPAALRPPPGEILTLARAG